MFDTLTPAELFALRSKLYDWGHAFAEIGNRLAFVALTTMTGTTENTTLWTHAERYQDAMKELYALRDELAA